MFEFEKVLSDNVSYSVSKIEYTTSSSGNSATGYKFEDRISVCEKNDKELAIDFSRRLYLEPERLFDVYICYNVRWTVKDADAVQTTDNEEIIRNLVSQKRGFIDGVIYSRISLLMSEITSAVGNPPIVTQPIFVGGDTD